MQTTPKKTTRLMEMEMRGSGDEGGGAIFYENCNILLACP